MKLMLCVVSNIVGQEMYITGRFCVVIKTLDTICYCALVLPLSGKQVGT